MKKIAILGSTGSIGTQTLEIVRNNPDLQVTALAAGRNVRLLEEQVREFKPSLVAVWDEKDAADFRTRVSDMQVQVVSGMDGLLQVASHEPAEILVTAIVGMIGIQPTIAAIRAGKDIALANKETMVGAGELINSLARQYHTPILPVDSEHSAIFQCLNGEGNNAIRRILLTASGGPFRRLSADDLQRVTVDQALCHPNWKMGAKITIDSATLMNKGFEMIEAHWLYGVAPRDIQVVVHPESVVHSAVEFADGAVLAQLGTPDMRLPIQYAFSYPQRLNLPGPRLDLFALGALHFEPADAERFPCLRLAYEAIERGGSAPCVLNAAGEVYNLAFRERRIGFTDIPRLTEVALAQAAFIEKPTLDDLFAIDEEVRRNCTERLPR